MKFVVVTSSFDDRGFGHCAITDIIEADKKPDSVYKSTNRKDIYIDYYESYEEAESFVRLMSRA